MSLRHSLTHALTHFLVRLLVRKEAARIGRRIRERRVALGMDHDALARCAGLAEADVRRWEEGDLAGFGSDALEVMRKSLRCTPAWLMAGEIYPGAFGEALCADRVIPLIGYIEDLPVTTRRRLVRFLLYMVVSGHAPRIPGRREVVVRDETSEGVGGSRSP